MTFAIALPLTTSSAAKSRNARPQVPGLSIPGYTAAHALLRLGAGL